MSFCAVWNSQSDATPVTVNMQLAFLVSFFSVSFAACPPGQAESALGNGCVQVTFHSSKYIFSIITQTQLKLKCRAGLFFWEAPGSPAGGRMQRSGRQTNI